MRIGIHYCREFAEGQRKDEVILNDDTDLYMGMTDLKKSTMCFIGDKGREQSSMQTLAQDRTMP